MIEVKNITNANKQLHVVIEPVGAEVLELSGSDIQNSNSVSINNKAVSGSDFDFGAVYSGWKWYGYGR